jgi:TonB family protein
MTAFTNNSILRARQQEHQKLPKILAYGIGGSLAFHGIAAVALNYLPQPVPAPVEVTLIDSSELPPELKPSPQPPKIKPAPKPKTITKVTPTPTPKPSVKTTPTPTPSITPKPTPLVKAKPDLTPQVVKIVTRPVVPFIPAQKVTKTATASDFEKEQNQVRNSLLKNPSQQSQTVAKQSKKQVRSNPDQIPEASSQPGANSSSLNSTQLAFKDPDRSTETTGLSGTEPNSSAGVGQSDDQFNNDSPGNSNNSQAATPGNLAARNIDKTGSNGQPLTAGRTGRSPLARAELSSEAFGDDGSELAFNLPSGLGGNPRSSSSIGDSGNSQPLASAGTGKFGSSFNGSSAEGTGGDGSDGFEVALIPGNGGGSRSTIGDNAGSHGNGRPLASAGTNKFGRVSNGNVADGVSGDGGDGFGTAPIPSRGNSSRSAGGNLSGNGNSRSLISGGNNRLSKNSGANSGNEASGEDLGETTVPNGKITARNNAQSYITELRCLENCQPNDPGVVSKTTAVRIKLKLDDAGRVADASMIKSGGDQSLDGFAESAFKRMRFELPTGFTKRVFIVTMRFVKSREE